MEEPSSSEMSRPPPHAGGGENQDRKQRQKVKKQVCEEVVRRLKAQGHPYTQDPNYADELLAHFMRLPTRSLCSGHWFQLSFMPQLCHQLVFL